MNQLNQNNQIGKKLINFRVSHIIGLLKTKDDINNNILDWLFPDEN